jgi:outer membrane translocation and assembly module TamA
LAIAEGPSSQLGRVDLAGEDLPAKQMLAAAKLPFGKVANWRQIQDGIWALERVVKRMGFFEVKAAPDRIFDDSAHVLDLRIQVAKGPLYHFGEVRFTGLTPELADQARRVWRPQPGDPYDFAYSSDFFQEFAHVVDFRKFSKYEPVVQKGAGDHVMDVEVVFVAR